MKNGKRRMLVWSELAFQDLRQGFGLWQTQPATDLQSREQPELAIEVTHPPNRQAKRIKLAAREFPRPKVAKRKGSSNWLQ